MKKGIKIILIILCTVSLVCIIYSISKRINKQYFITDHEQYYDLAIYYLEKNNNDENKDKEDYQFLTDYYGFEITSDGKNDYAYMWIQIESYYVKNNRLYNSIISSKPYKFIFKNGQVQSYKTTDKEDYKKFIKDEFMNEIKDKALSINIDNLSIKDKLEKHYSYLGTLEIVDENTIELEDLISSEFIDKFKNYDDTYGTIKQMETGESKYMSDFHINSKKHLVIDKEEIYIDDVKGYIVVNLEGLENVYVLTQKGDVYFIDPQDIAPCLIYENSEVNTMVGYNFCPEKDVDCGEVVIGLDNNNKYINLRDLVLE